MKKILSVFVLMLLLLVVAGCNSKRTYVADGTYMAWKLTTHTIDLELDEETTVKIATPAYVIVTVTIHKDEIVSFYIDERQATATPVFNEDGSLKEVKFAFNDRTKKELRYDYNMEFLAPQGEWFLQASNLERAWLKGGEIEALSSVSIVVDDYIEVAKAAVDKAKNGKVGAFTIGEHYPDDVVWVEGEIDAKGKITNITFDAKRFAGESRKKEGIYEPDHPNYLKFEWDSKTKYDSYPEMKDGKMWQDQIDTFTEYINENGWDGTIFPNAQPGPTRMKGVNKEGKEIEALSSVTIEVKGEIEVMNMLYNFFPYAWD